MKEIIIKDADREFLAVVREVPSRLKIVGNCTVIKENGKYSISNVRIFPQTLRIEAIGFKECTHIVNNVCYNKQKRLGYIDSPEIVDCLNKLITL